MKEISLWSSILFRCCCARLKEVAGVIDYYFTSVLLVTQRQNSLEATGACRCSGDS